MWLWLMVTSYQNKAFKKLSTKIQNSDFPNQPHYLSQILETQKIQLDFFTLQLTESNNLKAVTREKLT